MKMWRVGAAWLAVSVCWGGSAAAAVPTRLDPALRMATQQAVVTPALSKRLNLKAGRAGVGLADVFIDTTDVPELRKIIEQWDGRVRSVMGSIVTADVPLAMVADLAQLDIVRYVEAAKPVATRLNQSAAVVNIDDVNNATKAAAAGLSSAYTGNGVLVGIVDTGIDCDHGDFVASSGSTRLLAYWDQTKTSGSGVSEISSTTGTEYTGSSLTNGTCASASPDGDGDGHGTHVAGIAVSDDTTYQGAAPGSTIIAVKHNAQDAKSGGSFATTVVDAVNYIFRKAQAQSPKKPAVVNLSLGTSLGAHDGTSLFERSLDALLKNDSAEKQGRAIVNAAGNERFSSADSEASTFGGIHATISQTSTDVGYDFLVRNSSITFSTFGGAQVDIWLSSSSSCTVEVDAYAKTSKTTSVINMAAVAAGGSALGSANTDGNFEIALDFSDNSNANNSKQHALVTISRASGSNASAANYSFDVVFRGTCSGDAWLYPDLTAAVSFRKVAALPVSTNSTGSYAYASGDSDRTLTIPGTAKLVIAVGSFMGVARWTDINGTAHDQFDATGGTAGAISLFSSLGPTPDARTKPELVAPGEPIISTLASTVSVAATKKGDATHHKLEGTSMAAPFVTGTVALMLERNGCLTPTEIKNALTSTATSDSNTGSVPNNTYGYGKLDALAAVKAITAQSCAPSNANDVGAGSALEAETTGGSTGGTTTSDTSGGGGCNLLLGRCHNRPFKKVQMRGGAPARDRSVLCRT